MKGGAIITDRQLFATMFDSYVKSTGKADVDLFWDFLPYMEMLNRDLVNKGKQSILNAFDSKGIILDIGTPELLTHTKNYLNANRHN